MADEVFDSGFPEIYVYVALGTKGKDPAAAVEVFRYGMRRLEERASEPGYRWFEANFLAGLLPLVERIDPGLVRETLWRAVARGPPRSTRGARVLSVRPD